jgi:hypothetical protein
VILDSGEGGVSAVATAEIPFRPCRAECRSGRAARIAGSRRL